MTDLPETPTNEQIAEMRAFLDTHDRLAAADQIAATNALYAPVADILKSDAYAALATDVADALAALPSSATRPILALFNVKTALDNLYTTVRVEAAGLIDPES